MPAPLRIALYHNLPSGGARRAVYEMVKGLAQRGHVIDEFCPTTADRRFFPLAPFVRHTVLLPFQPRGVWARRVPFVTPYVTAARLLTDLTTLAHVNRQAAATIDAGEYDVIFAHDCQLSMNPALLRQAQTPTLFYCHHGVVRKHDRPRRGTPPRTIPHTLKRAYYALPVHLYPWWRDRAARRAARRAGQVLVNSRFAADQARAVYGIAGAVCYLGVDLDTFRPLGLPPGDYVLSVGAIHYFKGYRFLLRALACLPPATRPRLLIAANSADPEEQAAVMALAARLGVNLTIQRVMDDRELARLYNRALAFVYTPYLEPWGLAAVEAMACGAPVVAVGEGGVRESVRHEETGLLTPRHEEAFATALARVLAQPDLRGELGARAAPYVRQTYPWSATIDCLEPFMARGNSGA